MAIAEILRSKGSEVHTIPPDATVFAAVQRMVAHGIGSLVVTEGKHLVGIMTERDYLRKVVLEGRTSKTTLVRQIMTPSIVVAAPSDGLDACLEIMTVNRVRHLPVLDGSTLAGIVSMGDLVKAQLADKQLEITQLVEYIQSAGCAPS